MRPLQLAVLLLLVASCEATSPPLNTHAAHDPQAERVKASLADAFGMRFESAGPHHELGKTDDGVQLDLVGVPVEQVVLSVPDDDAAAGEALMPHIRDLLHGPPRVYEWAEDALACHAAGNGCEQRFEQGNLEARVTSEGGFVVLTVSRGSG
ncbi:MAG TPA: hypothetical protein VHK28_10215 [Candidatus Limnocylindria bacterium]|nr:hypothetical protein [Candidatus Limnocylindria bacterium]